MTEFTVHMANRPGQLAELTRRLADAEIHIEALAAFASADQGVVRLVADDETQTRRVLHDADLRFDEHRVITTIVANRPGAVATLTRSLADTGVNIDAMYLLRSNGDTQQFALAVNDPESARQRLAM